MGPLPQGGLRIAGEDALVEFLQLRAWICAELVSDDRTGMSVSLQCFGRAGAVLQHPHQLMP
jgi:hypothetical protein